MFKLVITVKRGSAASLAATWARHPSIEEARAAAAAALREERVQKVAIVRDEGSGTFVEWLER